MDEQTLAAYDADPQKYCRDWLDQKPPEEIHTSVRRYFLAGSVTADIGCGCGREVDWLNRQGWPCTGYEPSAGLRAEARRLYPGYEFLAESLPLLAGIPDWSFDNVLCETVLMHVPGSDQPAALDALLRILRPGGILRMSWRGGKDRRDPAGRLYELVDITALKERLTAGGADLLDEGKVLGSSGAKIHHIVARRA
ncbi:MAG TPA: class I SAM-dependent methyltransferase [Bryobacteraceae bacterium]|jgi:SAM-dependent methyltransferase|nr:class I SAM-dependent methyltransferase [Bryobacteraceae bacterium]